MTDLDHSTRYDLITTDQASPSEVAAWLKEPGFAAYVEKRQAMLKAPDTAPAPSHINTALVPAEPTWEMQVAGRDAMLAEDPDLDLSTDDARACYLAMLAKATIRATSPAQAVKPLEWHKTGTVYSASTVLGEYMAGERAWISPRAVGNEAGVAANRAAAQADYEQRIRSALVASPQPARETEAGLIERAHYMVNNPSAWDSFDQKASDIIADCVAALRTGTLTDDVCELIIAARIVAYEDQSAEAIRQLDKAVEKFGEAVAWDNEPDAAAALRAGEQP